MSLQTGQRNGHGVSPFWLYGIDAVRSLEMQAIDSGVTGYELMSRAATAAVHELRARWPAARDLLVVCGGGNNGGDGYMFARLAHEAGLTPRVMASAPLNRLTGDAARAANDCVQHGVIVEAVNATRIAYADVIVDALLGIGLQHDVRADLVTLISMINESGRPVLALDVPSGLSAETGDVRGAAVRAAATVTFVALKAGLYLGAGPEYAGEVVLADLNIGSISLLKRNPPKLKVLRQADLVAGLPPRRRQAHKGDFGHVLVVGGGEGMPGAARLAGEAALRAGAGRVTAAVAIESTVAAAAGCPELMVRGLIATAATDLLQSADVLAIGPGLGRTEWGRAAFSNALHAARSRDLPIILDADALNLLAEQPRMPLPARCVLTPHPGEAARLLGCSTAEIQRDRLSALKKLQAQYSATVVLKGAGTLVSDDIPWICDRGTPVMAAPGMGDVLTGVIAALLGQGMLSAQAARLGVLWHAVAGEAAALGRDRGVLAGEVSECLSRVIAP
ncbi:MAG: NAD(P)H-hydrate dehydratase [Gammaproteobacteria bacterium]|nr:NAD(P)H-hydrate dehydratase [Gammaproteobacteria bacterium]